MISGMQIVLRVSICSLPLHPDWHLYRLRRSVIGDELFGISCSSLLLPLGNSIMLNFLEDELTSMRGLWLHQVASLRRDGVERALLGVVCLHCTIWMDIEPR